MSPFTVLIPGDWPSGRVDVRFVENRRRILPEVESLIESAWAAATAKLGVHLFDGPMCRLESWTGDDHRLSFELSLSSYKPFFGTNITHPDLADRFGPDVMANPVGVSPSLQTSDGKLLFGRRNNLVAYYPSRIHPFAGCLEPGDADVFAAVRRELSEELSLTEITDLRCTGVVAENQLRQTELIFAVTTSLTRARVEARLDPSEHQSTFAIPATADAVESTLRAPSDLTPIAVASLLLWGRLHFGAAWYRSMNVV